MHGISVVEACLAIILLTRCELRLVQSTGDISALNRTISKPGLTPHILDSMRSHSSPYTASACVFSRHYSKQRNSTAQDFFPQGISFISGGANILHQHLDPHVTELNKSVRLFLEWRVGSATEPYHLQTASYDRVCLYLSILQSHSR
jgi:hypothetical protein